MNDSKPERVIEKVKKAAEKFKAPTVACFGLAFKPDIDDLRSSPALMITERLAEELDCKLLAVEPNVDELPNSLLSNGATHADTLEAVETADILVLLVDHKPFKRVPERKLAEKIVIDTRGIWT